MMSMMSMIYYELRCCCRPDTLLGWLPAPAGLRPGQFWRYPVTRHLSIGNVTFMPGSVTFTPPRESQVALVVNTYCRTWRRLWPDDPHPSQPLQEWARHVYPAFDSAHQPIEVFRHIPGFREAALHGASLFLTPPSHI